MSANELTTLRIGGSTMTESFWGVGGSQEVTKYAISLPDGVVETEAKTYICLSLSGPAQLVQQVVLAVQGT